METMLEKIRRQVAEKLQAARDLIASRNEPTPPVVEEDPNGNG